MNISVEISMYPLNESYIPPILAFIAQLKADAAVTVISNTMSTQVFGPAERVFALLQEAMRASWVAHGKVVFVTKFIGGDTRELA